MPKKGFMLSGLGIIIYAVFDVIFRILMGNKAGAGPMVVGVIISLCFIIPGVLSSLKAASDPQERKMAIIIQAVIVVGGFFFLWILVVAVIIFVFLVFITKGAVLASLLNLLGVTDGDNVFSQMAQQAEENQAAAEAQAEAERAAEDNKRYIDRETGRELDVTKSRGFVKDPDTGGLVSVNDLNPDRVNIKND